MWHSPYTARTSYKNNHIENIILWRHTVTSCCGHSVPSGTNPVHMSSVYGEVSQWLQHLPLKLSHSKLQKPENNGEQYAMSFTISWPVDYMSISRVASMWVISYLATHNWTRRARRNKNRIKSIELFSSGVQQGRLEHRKQSGNLGGRKTWHTGRVGLLKKDYISSDGHMNQQWEEIFM